MMFMNEMDIEDAQRRYRNHPVLGPASQTLHNLMECANRNSDGWAYWPKPCRAAKKLQELIEGYSHLGGVREAHFDRDREDATPAKLKAAYSPIKAFRTKSGLSFDIVEPR